MNAQIAFGIVINDELVTPDDIKAKDVRIKRLFDLLNEAQAAIRDRREAFDSMKRTYQTKVDRLTHDALYWKRQYERMVSEYEKI